MNYDVSNHYFHSIDTERLRFAMKRKNSIQTDTSTTTSTTSLSTILSNIGNIFSNFGSRFNLFAMIEKHDDIFRTVLSFLSIDDLNLKRLVSTKFKLAADFVFEFCHLPNIPNLFSFKDNNALPNQKVIEFRFECDQVTRHYTEKLVQTMGVEKIACFPKKEADLIKEAMGRNELTIHMYAKLNMPEKTEILSQKINIFKIINQYENKELRILKKLCTFEHAGKILPHFLSETQYDYLERLFNNQPCGRVVDGIETEPKINDKNQPTVQLCDEQGNLLDFSPRNTAPKF